MDGMHRSILDGRNVEVNIGWTECRGQYWIDGMSMSINGSYMYVFLKHTNVIEISIFNYLN